MQAFYMPINSTYFDKTVECHVECTSHTDCIDVENYPQIEPKVKST